MSTLKAWLVSLDLEKHLDVLEANSVDLDIFAQLTDSDLADLGITLGDRKRLLSAARKLHEGPTEEVSAGFQEQAAGFQAVARPSGRSLGELRQMTIMFVDLVNSTGLVQELGVEKYRDTLKAFQNCNIEAIQNNFGYFSQFIGDGVVAYFGYPVANEDDAERAVLTALEIAGKVGEIPVHPQRKLSVRIGIATGDVLIEDLMHSTTQADNFALGNIPNLAARLQGVAKPGQVAVSERTYQLLGGNFRCAPAGEQTLKGFLEPVNVWLVEDSQTTELRFDKRKSGALAPLIGREDELSLLSGRWKAATRGEGQAVFLSGEAGLGKSRLAEEMNRRLIKKNGRRLSFQCSPYHQNSSFYPVKSHIAHAIGLIDSDTPTERGEKLRRFLDAGGGASEDDFAVLASFLAAAEEDAETVLPPEEAKSRTLDVLLRYAAKTADQKPVLILFEDLQWIDPSSEELLNLLIDRLDDMRIMVLGTYRPEFKPRWLGKPKVTTLSLPRLGARETRDLLKVLNKDNLVLNGLMQAIVTRSDGIPLFVEELVSMLARDPRKDWSDVHEGHELFFPSSLKDLLRARLDHLSVTPDTVSICAALGRSFTPDLVAAVADRPVRDVQAELSNLVQAQILVAMSASAEARYSFRHAMIRDVAYDAILPQRAKQLHHQIAETLVSQFPRVCAQNPEILALHYQQAEEFSAARDKLQEAAALSLRNFASREAIAHLNTALDLHSKMPLDDSSESREIDLRQNLAVALEMRGWGSPDIVANLEKLIALNEMSGDWRVAFVNLHQLIGENLIAGLPDRALTQCERMARMIAEEKDPVFHTLSEHNSGIANLLHGAFDRAITHFDRALTFREQTDLKTINQYYPADPELIDRVMRCWARALKADDRDATEKELKQVITLTHGQTSEFSKCYALSIIATIFCTLGQPEQARRFAEKAHVISDKIEFVYWEAWSSIVMGWAEAKTGAQDGGIARLRAGLERYLKSGSGQIVAFSHTLLADAYLAMDAVDEAAASIEDARKALEDSALGFHTEFTDRLAGQITARTQKL